MKTELWREFISNTIEESGEAVVIDSGPTEPIEPSKPTEVEETTIETTSTVTVEPATSTDPIVTIVNDLTINLPT